MDALTSPWHWAVVASTVVVISIIIALHYEVLSHCIRMLPSVKRRRRVIVLILIIMATHAVEIWIFGLAYYFLLNWADFGGVDGIVEAAMLFDYVYYSAMVYTTVGFGDLFPEGAIRFMTGMEALTGLVMITWSASFTFLEMQRDWQSETD